MVGVPNPDRAVLADRTDSPVLIIGTERSGSNLLRLVIESHPDVAVPHPPHLVRFLSPIAHTYGDLHDEGNRRRLARDAHLLIRRHPHPWEHPIDLDALVAEAAPSLFGVVSAIYEQYRRAAGKSRWGCKSTFMVAHVDEVLAEYPGARFLWLVRDPRDVAASARRSVFGHCHPLLTARLWTAQQTQAETARRRWGVERIHLIRYEDLVREPEPVLRTACTFLNLPWDPCLLRHQQSPSASRTASLSRSWAPAGRAINTESVGRHATTLSTAERRYVEQVAGPMMRRLGYRYPPAPPLRPPTHATIMIREAALRAGIEIRSMLQDRNYSQRMLRDLTVRWLRLKALIRTVRPAGQRELARPARRTPAANNVTGKGVS